MLQLKCILQDSALSAHLESSWSEQLCWSHTWELCYTPGCLHPGFCLWKKLFPKRFYPPALPEVFLFWKTTCSAEKMLKEPLINWNYFFHLVEWSSLVNTLLCYSWVHITVSKTCGIITIYLRCWQIRIWTCIFSFLLSIFLS